MCVYYHTVSVAICRPSTEGQVALLQGRSPKGAQSCKDSLSILHSPVRRVLYILSIITG